MEELDPFCDKFQEIDLTDTFYDNIYLLCKYVDDETIGDENATTIALEKFHNDPNYNDNLYKMWLYSTIINWHKIVQDSGKFTTDEEASVIYLMRAITEIARTAICYDGCNILGELVNIIKNSFAEYTITGWKFLCSERTFEALMKSQNSRSLDSSQYVSEFEIEGGVEACDENIDNADEIREFNEKCQVLSDIASEFLSSKFTLSIIKLASQKFIDRTIQLQSDLVFNVPKTYHKWVEPKVKKHEKKHEKKIEKNQNNEKPMLEDVEAPPDIETDLRSLYEILPSRMCLETDSDEFWASLQKKYAMEIDDRVEKTAATVEEDPDNQKKTKKAKKGKKMEN